MAFAKRIGLFLMVNILVLITISITANIIFGALGINPNYITPNGLDLTSLLIFCAIFGFCGSFISLALSRVMAKWMMGVKVIDLQNASGAQRDLVTLVHRLAQKAGLPAMPQVGIYESPEVNAFATGPTRSRALVAVSTGLLDRMDGAAVEGVLGHEIAHVANGDMVTMTLLQGIVNTFSMFLARVLAWGVSQAMAGDRDRDRGPSPMINWILIMVFEIAFSLLGAIVVAWYSRKREFRADAGGAYFAGKDKMVHALESLKSQFDVPVDNRAPALSAFKINGGRRGGFVALFSSHPDLDDRIRALKSQPFGTR